MRTTRTQLLRRPLAAALATAVGAGVALAGAAAPATAAPGDTSLATVLAADGNRFDRNWDDFDILDRAVRTVLAAKPGSPVAVLADGSQTLTAFIPTDRAFRRLVADLSGSFPATERATFQAVGATFDVDTIEQVLLYHVVPGAKVNYGAAQQSDGARLENALGLHLRVFVRDGEVFIGDRDRNSPNPKVLKSAKNVNRGNLQIAHGINRVLRPADL